MENNNFNAWLEHCLKFDKLNKQYGKILSYLTPENLEKYNNLESFDEEFVVGKKEQWQYLDLSESEGLNSMYLSIKKGDYSYNVRVIDKILNLTNSNKLEAVKNNTNLTEDSYLLIEIENPKKNMRYFLGAIVVKVKKDITLILKEMSLVENEWVTETETLTLDKEETKGLLI